MNKKDIIIAAMIINSIMLLTIFAFSKKSRPAPAPMFKTPVASQMVTAPKPLAPPPPASLAATSPSKSIEKPKVSQPVPVVATKKAPQGSHQPQKGPRTIIVKQGDALEKLAKQYSVSVQAIMSANNMKNTNLSVGKALIIPEKSAAKAVMALSKPKAVSDEAVYYTVQPGDNPWVIARKNHIKVDDLMKLNKMNKQSAKQLRPGNKLRIK